MGTEQIPETFSGSEFGKTASVHAKPRRFPIGFQLGSAYRDDFRSVFDSVQRTEMISGRFSTRFSVPGRFPAGFQLGSAHRDDFRSVFDSVQRTEMISGRISTRFSVHDIEFSSFHPCNHMNVRRLQWHRTVMSDRHQTSSQQPGRTNNPSAALEGHYRVPKLFKKSTGE